MMFAQDLAVARATTLSDVAAQLRLLTPYIEGPKPAHQLLAEAIAVLENGLVDPFSTGELPPLTDQQFKFVVCSLKGMNGSDAFREAYPASRTWQDNSVWTNASQTKANPKVKRWINTIRTYAIFGGDEELEGQAAYLVEVCRKAFPPLPGYRIARR